MQAVHPVTACCAELYSHPVAAFLLGDSFHPGGLALTDDLLRAARVGTSDRVLDAGSGRGVSTVHIAETTGCTVTGLTIEGEGVAQGDRLAVARGVADRVRFVQGDIMALTPARPPYDVVVMECVLSTLPNMPEALSRIRDVLRPGGLLAITDVTRVGDVPPDLEGVTAAALCLAGALPLADYASLIAGAGFAVHDAHDLPDVVDGFIDRAMKGLMMAEIAAGLGKLDVAPTTLQPAKVAMKAAKGLVNDDRLGYGMVVASAAS